MEVVDDELKVHGLEELRVIDAAVILVITSTITDAPIIMIAEKSAAMIKSAAR
jgi:choline dehydrogenase